MSKNWTLKIKRIGSMFGDLLGVTVNFSLAVLSRLTLRLAGPLFLITLMGWILRRLEVIPRDKNIFAGLYHLIKKVIDDFSSTIEKESKGDIQVPEYTDERKDLMFKNWLERSEERLSQMSPEQRKKVIAQARESMNQAQASLAKDEDWITTYRDMGIGKEKVVFGYADFGTKEIAVNVNQNIPTPRQAVALIHENLHRMYGSKPTEIGHQQLATGSGVLLDVWHDMRRALKYPISCIDSDGGYKMVRGIHEPNVFTAYDRHELGQKLLNIKLLHYKIPFKTGMLDILDNDNLLEKWRKDV